MSIKSFFKLVGIQTKVASILPFLFGTFYTLYTFPVFKLRNTFLWLGSLLFFQMATTAIEQYRGYTRSLHQDEQSYHVDHIIFAEDLSLNTVRSIIYVMLVMALILGILLTLATNGVVLVLGGISFILGLLYTLGPIPISRTPFSEVIYGGVMGLIIPFLSIYIHIFDHGILSFTLEADLASISFNLGVILPICIVCIPFINGIANMMLARNICDWEEDLSNQRYTLPIYIGKESALSLWTALYYVAYAAIILGVILQILPVTSLLVLLTLLPVQHNINQFKARQFKGEHCIGAMQNFFLLSSSYILSIVLMILARLIF